MSGQWQPTGASVLEWITSATPEPNVAGFEVEGLPESIYVLHRMYERVDGQPLLDGEYLDSDGDGDAWTDALSSLYRVLPWQEYARRRGVQLTDVHQWPFTYADDGVASETAVFPPDEGTIRDVATWNAVIAALTEHSTDGGDTWCTAYYYDSVTFHPPSSQGPNVYRGCLAHSDDLIAPEYANRFSPQNLWPDDRSWVLLTGYDNWHTKISGSSQLIDAIAARPELETLRVPR